MKRNNSMTTNNPFIPVSLRNRDSRRNKRYNESSSAFSYPLSMSEAEDDDEIEDEDEEEVIIDEDEDDYYYEGQYTEEPTRSASKRSESLEKYSLFFEAENDDELADDFMKEFESEMKKIGQIDAAEEESIDAAIEVGSENNPKLAAELNKINEGELNEALTGMFALSLVVSSPKILEALAKLIKFIINFGKRKQIKAGTEKAKTGVLVDALMSRAKKIEKGITWIFKKFGEAASKKLYGEVKPDFVKKTEAGGLLLVIALLALYSGGGSLIAAKAAIAQSAGEEAVKSGVEGVLTYIKSKEAVHLKKELAKFGMKVVN